MGSVLEFGINMSMLMGGNLVPEATKAGQALSDLGRHAQGLQKLSGRMQAFQKQQSRVELSREKLVKARENVRRLREEFQRTSQPTESMRRKFAEAQKQAGLLGADFQTQQKKLAELNSELQRSGVNTSKLISEQSRLASETDKVRAAQDRLTRAQEKYSSLRGQFSWGNMKGDILASMGIFKAMQKPVQIDMEFEQAMANVRAVSNPREDDFRALRTQAIQLGSTTQFTATQAANAQEILSRAGLKTQEIIMSMPSVLSMASAEGIDIPQAADILITTAKGMKMDISQLPLIADTLSYASMNANTNAVELGEALKKAAPLASDLGMSLEQVVSYLTGMTAAVRGAEAGTAFFGGVSRITKKQATAKKVLDELGIRTLTKTGRLVEIPELLMQVDAKLSQMGAGKAQEYRGKLFGDFASSFSALTADVKSGEQGKMESGLIAKKDGSAYKASKLRNDTLKGDITSLGSAWEGLMIRIGNGVEPLNRFLTQGLTTGIQKINEMIDALGPFKDILLQGAEAVGAYMVMSKVWKYTKLAYDTFKAWTELKAATGAVEALSTAANSAGTVATNLNNASKAAGIFGMSLSTALGTLGLIALACYEIYQHWEQITAWAQRAGEAISNIDTGKIQAAKVGNLSRTDIDYGVSVMSSTYMPPSIKNATGGIYTHPIWTWAAEKGAEAIIPLTDKSRGIPLLMQAAHMLGIMRAESTPLNPLTKTTPLNPPLAGGTSVAGVLASPEQGEVPERRRGRKITPLNPPLAGGTSVAQSANTITENTSLIQQANELGGMTHAGRFIDVHSVRSNDNANPTWPSVNLTVNITGDAQDMSIADKIKQAVIDALDELTSRQERLAYA